MISEISRKWMQARAAFPWEKWAAPVHEGLFLIKHHLSLALRVRPYHAVMLIAVRRSKSLQLEAIIKNSDNSSCSQLPVPLRLSSYILQRAMGLSG